MLNAKHWKSVYWLYAGTLPLVLFALEAAKLLLYPVTRAPNVHVAIHISLMGLFYGLWIFIPHLVWQVISRSSSDKKTLLVRLAGVGLSLSALHLFSLALILRVIYSPPGWGIPDILKSFGEVWLGYIGFWMVAYSGVVALILWRFNGQKEEHLQPKRFEVRHNGKIISVPFADIYWIKAAGNYAELYTQTGMYTVRQTLKQVKAQLPTHMFLTSHRSALVNSRHVLAMAPNPESGTYSISLTGDHTAPLSRRNLTPFKTLLKSAP